MQSSDKMSRLTIATSERFFHEHSNELLSDYRSVVDLIRRARIDRPLSNSNYLHALCLTQLMVEQTSYTFRMLTGGAIDSFIDTLRPALEDMLGRIRCQRDAGENAFARILVVDGDPGCSSLVDLSASFPDELEIGAASTNGGSNAKIRHFIVGDEDMLRDEEFHQPLTRDSDANAVQAAVSFYSPAKAKIFASRFDTFWRAVTEAERQHAGGR